MYVISFLNAASVFTLFATDSALTSELQTLYQSLQKCLDLRDKYIRLSRQRLGDNPRDHDSVFTGLDEELADLPGARPDLDHSQKPKPPHQFEPWQIYPRPPPPHWHWNDKQTSVPDASPVSSARTPQEFNFSECAIPGVDSREFAIDDKGVFQVYESSQGSSACLCV